MSQPHPTPDFPPQPPKKSSTRKILAVVIVVVVLVAGFGAYGAYRIFQASDQPNYEGSTTTIRCQGCVQTVYALTCNCTIEVLAQSATLTLELGSRVTIGLHVDGKYCSITINGGHTRLTITGQSNVINATKTVLLSNVDSGQGNVVHQ